ncbi:MAG: DNA-processing protein DprA [Propionibacteriaceae bacterium]|nr:DNA-processing protein DprA [Propionibacteriaceae bacterium]
MPPSDLDRLHLWPSDPDLDRIARPLPDWPGGELLPAGPPGDAERVARMGLAAVWEPGDRRVTNLIAEHGAEFVWQSLRQGEPRTNLARRAQAVDVDRLLRQTELLKLRFIAPGDGEWPVALADLDRAQMGNLGGMPIGLWLAGPGHLADLGRRSVAVVGSRAATAYGEHVAADLAAGLAETGWTITSGGAYGIDAAAHRAALAVGGPTVAFMAGGLSNVYPPGNAQLLGRVKSEGLLATEHAPDRTPSRPRFLARNRLIAGLAQATVVVEGGVRSGAANTVRWALALDRPTFAVPGPVTSAMSWTPHRLIRDGEAVLVTSAEDVVAGLGPFDAAVEADYPEVEERLDRLRPDDRAVFEQLPLRGQVTAGDVAERTGLAVPGALASLGRLREERLVEQTERGTWRILPDWPEAA